MKIDLLAIGLGLLATSSASPAAIRPYNAVSEEASSSTSYAADTTRTTYSLAKPNGTWLPKVVGPVLPKYDPSPRPATNASEAASEPSKTISIPGVPTTVFSAPSSSTAAASSQTPSLETEVASTVDPKSTSTPAAYVPTSDYVLPRAEEGQTVQLVFPNRDLAMNPADFFKFLDATLGDDKYEASYLSGYGLEFVSVTVTDAQRETIVASNLVRGVVADEPLDDSTGAEEPTKIIPAKQELAARDMTIVIPTTQANPDWGLKRLMQEPGTPYEPMTNYTFSPDSGFYGTIYIIDSGENQETRDQQYMAGAFQPRWIYAGSQRAKYEQTDDSENGHGTCITTIANGAIHGVTKRSSMVLVKASRTLRDTLDAMLWTINDCISTDMRRFGVISFSRSFRNPINPLVLETVERILAECVVQDIPFVTAAGNDFSGSATPKDVDTYPQLLADKYHLIVVGAVDEAGNNATFSKGGPLVSLMAPGVNTSCAYDATQDQIVSGTSFAVPYVAGVISYIMTTASWMEMKVYGHVSENCKALISNLAYPRVEGGSPVLYRGGDTQCNLDATNTTCPPKPQMTTIGLLSPTAVINIGR